MYQVLTQPKMVSTIKEVMEVHKESQELVQKGNEIVSKLKNFNESL